MSTQPGSAHKVESMDVEVQHTAYKDELHAPSALLLQRQSTSTMSTQQSSPHGVELVDVELQHIDNYESSQLTTKPLLDDLSAHPKGWPTLPSNVKSSVLSVVSDAGVDIFLLLFAFSFLAFALIVHYYDQAPVRDHPKTTEALVNATKYGPTVFPILFACVVGRASHSILVWRLEKGERIGTLDMLAGSTSLTSAVTSQLKLRILSALGISLVAIWALSPVGGQACLRQMTLGHTSSIQATSFTYMVQRGFLWENIRSDSMFYAIIGADFSAALLAPPKTKASPRDIWGNTKIPRVETYEASSTADKEGWYTMEEHETIYASLVGIPMAGIDDADMVDYTTRIEARYFHLDCPRVGMTFLENYQPPFENYTGFGASLYTWENTTKRSLGNPKDLKPLNFTHHSSGATILSGRYSQCLLTTTYVEAQVVCATSSTCTVAKIRRSKLEHASPAYTLLDNSTLTIPNWVYFARGFVKTMDGLGGSEDDMTAVQEYLVDPDLVDLPSTVFELYSNPLESPIELTDELYEIRMGQLMNTYWDCMVAMYAIPFGLNENTTAMTDAARATSSADVKALAYSATSNGTKTIVDNVIQAHIAWTVALVVASTAMIVAGFVSPAIRHFMARGPDVMLNISGLATRDSPFVALPVSGSFMDATDRARLVKDHKVRFGDVSADTDVGRLAIGTMDLPGSTRNVSVRRKRLYM